MSGLPALPIAATRPPVRPISALTIPQWSRISALVMTVALWSGGRAKIHRERHRALDRVRRCGRHRETDGRSSTVVNTDRRAAPVIRTPARTLRERTGMATRRDFIWR